MSFLHKNIVNLKYNQVEHIFPKCIFGIIKLYYYSYDNLNTSEIPQFLNLYLKNDKLKKQQPLYFYSLNSKKNSCLSIISILESNSESNIKIICDIRKREVEHKTMCVSFELYKYSDLFFGIVDNGNIESVCLTTNVNKLVFKFQDTTTLNFIKCQTQNLRQISYKCRYNSQICPLLHYSMGFDSCQIQVTFKYYPQSFVLYKIMSKITLRPKLIVNDFKYIGGFLTSKTNTFRV